jgi:hypothetical protein
MLYNNEKEIEFDYSVQKTYTTEKEGVYFAFPVAASSPKFLCDPTRHDRSIAGPVEGRKPGMVQHSEMDGSL